MIKVFFLLIVAISFSQEKELGFIDKYISKGISEYNLSGLGIVIVQDGKVLKKQGFGYANIKDNKVIDSKSVFPIASVSKHFISIALLKELDIHNISVNTPIIEFFSRYDLSNIDLFENITISDLLSHQIGIKERQGHFFLYENDFTSKEQIEKSWVIKSTSDKFCSYNNTSYRLACEIIEELSGKPWDVYLNDVFLKPLGMSSTFGSQKEIESFNNIKYYSEDDGDFKEIKYNPTNSFLDFKGGIYSSLDDMALWMNFLLNDSDYSEYIETAQTSLVSFKSGSHPYNKVSNVKYGMGLKIQDFNNIKILYHTGGLPGLSTLIFMIPEKKTGVFMVSNSSNKGFHYLLMLEIIDAYLELPYRNYAEKYKDYYLNYYKKFDDNKSKPIRIDLALYNEKVKRILGKYSNDIYGYIDLIFTGNELQLSFEHHPSIIGKLTSIEKNKLEFDLDSLYFPKAEVTIKANQLAITFPNSDSFIYNFKTNKK